MATILVEAARNADVDAGDVLESLDASLVGILSQLDRPDGEDLSDVLRASAVLIRNGLQMFGGISWVRCSVGDQGALVSMVDE